MCSWAYSANGSGKLYNPSLDIKHPHPTDIKFSQYIPVYLVMGISEISGAGGFNARGRGLINLKSFHKASRPTMQADMVVSQN